jgi:hypothetical protein
MNALLTRLGVPPDIQAFFKPSDPISFDYGGADELFDLDFHKVPTTANLWMAGELTAAEVIISFCAMEALAYLTINRMRHGNLDKLACIAVGNRLQKPQWKWIREQFPARKFTLVFGADFLGRLTDIKLGAGLKNIPLNLQHSNSKILIYHGARLRVFDEDKISFDAFQRAFGIRSRIRTRKPAQHLTFLEQLKHESCR